MYQIAEDNRKQAVATEAIARDAKRDSEIMKTITVVTLVYLPATFVCVRTWPTVRHAASYGSADTTEHGHIRLQP